MSRTTKDRTEALFVSKDVSSSQQLPSIVISSSTGQATPVKASVTVVDSELVEVHKALGTPPTSSSQPDHTVVGKHRVAPAKMESNCQTKGRLEGKQTATAPAASTTHKPPSSALKVPVCIDVHVDETSSTTESAPTRCTGQTEVKSINRPTTLTSPKPPEFSISPAESLSHSKASSSNEQMSSSGGHIPPSTSYKPPYSPSSLSVSFCK